jgi:hypothetical protein
MGQSQKVRFEPEDFPVLIKMTHEDEEGSHGYVWLCSLTSGYFFKKKYLMSRVDSIIIHLKICEFSKYLDERKIQMGRSLQKSFFQWIEKTLTDSGDGKLPFIGHFVFKNGRNKNSILRPNDINEAQIFLQRWAATLNYATQPLSVSVAALEFGIFCVALARS